MIIRMKKGVLLGIAVSLVLTGISFAGNGVSLAGKQGTEIILKFTVPQYGMKNKVLTYERSPDAAGAWYHKAVGIASSESSGGPTDIDWMNDMRDVLLDYNTGKTGRTITCRQNFELRKTYCFGMEHGG